MRNRFETTLTRLTRLIAALALVVALPVTAWAQASGEGSVALPLGSVAPNAQLEDLEGNEVELFDYLPEGKPALMEFWATWCENCEELQPQMDLVHQRYGDRLQVIAVAVGVSQSTRRIKRHLQSHDPGYPYLYDKRGNAVRAYEALATSIVVILDADRKVVYTGTGGDQDLVGAVERLLGS